MSRLVSIIFAAVFALAAIPAQAQSHESCAINSNPSSPGYGKVFCSTFPNGGAAVNASTLRVSCGRGACAVNTNPSSPGFQRVFCSAYAGGGAAVNLRTGKVSCGAGECYYANDGLVYCYDPSTRSYRAGSIDNCEEGSIDNCAELRQ